MAANQVLADLCATHGRALFRVATGILHDRHAAEDVCQQAFLKACEQITGGSAPLHLKAWLTRVVINECLHLLRRRKLELRPLGGAVAAGGDGDGAGQKTRLREPAAPERSIPETPLRESLFAGLHQLPDLTRAVVVLRIMHDFSGNEVVQLLGCSASEVSRRLYHGMEQLRRGLSADAAALEVGDHEP